MEAMGADISQKIRSAIKAKLIELGAYVDDELPDYIMVMVANKKSKNQMDDDLLLFLGNNTQRFTDWLHDVLERLQSVTADVTSKKRTTSTDMKIQTEDANHGSRAQTEMKAQMESGIFSPSSVKSATVEDVETQDEILAIRAELDADDPLAEELENEKSAGASTSKVIKRQHNVVAPIQRLNQKDDAKSVEHLSTRGSKRPTPIAIQPIPRKRRIPSSTVGAVLKRNEADEDDEEEKVRSSVLASVVRVSERRPSVPPNLQANKNLIMKAVAEAKKSVLEAAKKSFVKEVGSSGRQLFTRKNQSLFSRNPNPVVVLPNKTTSLTPNFDISINNSEPATLTEADNEDCMSLDSDERDKTVSLPPRAKNRIVHDNNEDKQISSPKFIVTLNGIDPDTFFSKIKFPLFNKDIRSSLTDEEESMIIEDEAEEPNIRNKISSEEMNKNSIRCTYWPSCKNGNECPYHHPTKQCKTFPNCLFGDKCLYIHPNCKYDATCTKQNCPYTHASKRIVGATTFKPKVLTSQAPDKKCKFFPNCTNLNCKFYHPKPCRYGLSCNQTDCMFYHPPLPSRDKLKWNSQATKTKIGD